MLPDFPLLYFGSLVVLLAFVLKLRRKLGLPVLLSLGLGLAALGFVPIFAIQVVGFEGTARALGLDDPNDLLQLIEWIKFKVIFDSTAKFGFFIAALSAFLHSRKLVHRERQAAFYTSIDPSRKW